MVKLGYIIRKTTQTIFLFVLWSVSANAVTWPQNEQAYKSHERHPQWLRQPEQPIKLNNYKPYGYDTNYNNQRYYPRIEVYNRYEYPPIPYRNYYPKNKNAWNDMPFLGGNNFPNFDRSNMPFLGGNNFPNFDRSNMPFLGGNNFPNFDRFNMPFLGGNNFPNFDRSNMPFLGGNNFPNFDRSNMPFLGGNNFPNFDRSNMPFLGGNNYPNFNDFPRFGW